MKEKIENVIKFIEGYVIECPITAGCGRCNEARQHVAALKEGLKDVNQEVEKRIKERMPSEEECVDWAKDETLNIDGGDNKRITFYLMVGCKWLRSRLTCSEKPNNSQKSEGGEG